MKIMGAAGPVSSLLGWVYHPVFMGNFASFQEPTFSVCDCWLTDANIITSSISEGDMDRISVLTPIPP